MATKKAMSFPSLNFIPTDPFYESIIGKISMWTLRVGRYIVIFTELVVIMSFASRFKLDRDLSDLNSSIVQKTAVVQSYADTEARMRMIQKKSEAVTKILKQNDTLQGFNTLIAKIPLDIKLLRLGYTPSELQVNGTARSSLSFAIFLQTLQREPSFQEVTIDQIKTGDTNNPGLAFAVRLSLQSKQIAPLTPVAAPKATLKQDTNF